MLLERYSEDINGTLPIVGLSKPLQLCTGGLRYLLDAGKTRVNAVLPDKGLAMLPLLLSFLLSRRKSPHSKPSWLNQIGKEVFFNLKTRSISVTNLGPAYAGDKRIKGKVTIGNGPGFEGTNYMGTIPEFAMRFATEEPRYPNNTIGDASKLSEWLFKDHAFVPPHIELTKSPEKIICILTRKANFENAIRDFKPFGVELRELVEFQYFKSGTDGELLYRRRLTDNAPDVNVFSSAGALAEFLFNQAGNGQVQGTDILLLADEETLAAEFLGLIPIEHPSFNNINFVFFSDSHALDFHKICSDMNFSVFALDGHMQQLQDATSSEQNLSFSDGLSQFEKKLERSLKKAERNFMPVRNSALDQYMKLLKSISSKVNVEGLPLSNETLFRAIKLQKEIAQAWIARSTEDVEQIKSQITSLKELLRFDRQLCDEIEMLWQLLDEHVNLLLDVPNTRSVVEFLKNNSEQQYVLVEEYETSAERARRFIESNELLNVTVVSLRALRGKFFDEPIIVPYLPSNRNSDLLSSASATENFFLFLTDFENQFLKTEVRGQTNR